METNDLTQIWDSLIDKLSHATSESNMDMYIRQITPVKLESNVICCTVPSSTLCSAIQQNFLSIILAALKEIAKNDNLSLKLEVENRNDTTNTETPKSAPSFKKDDEEKCFESNINKNQRFETFVVGNSNRFAAAAA